jgi:thiosulfate/3-mercaptopyruvate sulfurtransferase
MREAMMDTLVSTEWLGQNIDAPDLVLLDCSVSSVEDISGGFHNVSGRSDYAAGHIPGAGFADLKSDLADCDSTIEFAVPTPEQFCLAMGKLGVGDDSRVILYDTSYSAWAARVWWMLRWVGFDNAALLDGGQNAWTAEGRPLSTAAATHPARQLTAKTRPELIADRDEVLAGIDDDSIHLVDTMPEEFYRGDMSLYARPGHIPGAINANGLRLLDESGRFRPDEEQLALLDGERDARTITYCGGGIMASANAFMMTRLGFSDVAVYTASLQEWAADPANPMVTGSSPR